MSLYQNTMDMLELHNLLNSGEVSEEDLSDTIESIGAAWEERAEAVLCVIKNMRAEAAGIKAEEDRLAARRRAKERSADRLEDYLSRAMQALHMPKYESVRHKVSFITSHRIRVTDEAALLEWARENAPEVIKHGEDTISKDAIKTLVRTVNVPYVANDEHQNIQIG